MAQQNLSVTIELKYPFKNGIGEEVTSITIRRPKLKELRESQGKKNDAEREIYLLTTLTGLIPEDLDQMDALYDYKKVQEALSEMGKE